MGGGRRRTPGLGTVAYCNPPLPRSQGRPYLCCLGLSVLRVQVPNSLVFGCWVVLIIVQVSGKYTIIRYLEPPLVPSAIYNSSQILKFPIMVYHNYKLGTWNVRGGRGFYCRGSGVSCDYINRILFFLG